MLKVRRPKLTWADLEMSKLELTKLITHYAQSNKADNKSAKTVTWYSEMLGDYVKFLESTSKPWTRWATIGASPCVLDVMLVHRPRGSRKLGIDGIQLKQRPPCHGQGQN